MSNSNTTKRASTAQDASQPAAKAAAPTKKTAVKAPDSRAPATKEPAAKQQATKKPTAKKPATKKPAAQSRAPKAAAATGATQRGERPVDRGAEKQRQQERRVARAGAAKERAASLKASKAAAYAAATVAMMGTGEGALRAAALVLKTKGARQSDRKRAASVMGLIGGSIGGHNRAANLTAEQRTAIARKAGLARQLKAREERAKKATEKPTNTGGARRKPAA